MSSKNDPSILDEVLACAESHFQKPVLKHSAPGGDKRAVFRLQFEDQSVIASKRPNYRRTHMEAVVLSRLSAHCDVVPRCLGLVDHVFFQSDVGEHRLNVEIAARKGKACKDLAGEAVATIFKYQSAAELAELDRIVPPLGATPDWVAGFVAAARKIEGDTTELDPSLDVPALCAALAQPARTFLKWDCRSGNAAIGHDRKLRWFDFEYAGLRHGAEDIAWLLGDETWPMIPSVMEEIVRDALPATTPGGKERYMDYLALYMTFHCAQRLELIHRKFDEDGWVSRKRIRKYDFLGVHPDFGSLLAEAGAFYAERSPLTRPLVRNFERARDAFDAF